MPEKKTIKQTLQEFCDGWNARGFFPRLHPIQMVPISFAKDVTKAQLGIETVNPMVLPVDVDQTPVFRDWAKSFVVKNPSDTKQDIAPFQLAAVDRKNRVGILDIEVSVDREGYVDQFSDLKIMTMLSGYSRRKTWIFPVQLEEYDRYVESGRTAITVKDAEDRIKLVQNSLQSMIRAQLKDVEETSARVNKKDLEKEKLQTLLSELEAQGLPVTAMLEKKEIISDAEAGVGTIVFNGGGSLSCNLTTASTGRERSAFIALVKALKAEH